MNPIKIAHANNLPAHFLSRPRLAVFGAIAFYIIGFVLLSHSIGAEAVPLAIVPVLAIGWFWGWRAGVLSSLLTIAFAVLILNLSGFNGWVVIDDLGDILIIASISLVGGLIGYSRELNERASREILAKQRAEAELRKYQDQLEQVVASRTAELKQANESLRQALAREHDLTDLKSRFVGMVSHEYRSPLTSILSGVGMLRRYDHKLSEAEKATIFQKIESTVQRMTQMLDDVLGFNNFEKDAVEITLVSVSATAFCRDAMENARTILLAAQAFNFSSNCSECQIFIDKDLVKQALFNLLSNAVRYSAPTSTISVDVDSRDERVLIRIQDEGMGIPVAEQSRIFEPFYRGQNVENIAGTGLGLVMSKHAIERHNGTLTFDSAINKGTTFTITLPMLPSSTH